MITNKAGLQLALEAFLTGKDFKAGVITCTRAARQKTSYVVELMPTGAYRVLLMAQVGNKDDSPGHLFLDLPTLENKDLSSFRGSEENYFSQEFTLKHAELTTKMWEQFKKA